eukprot:15463893-Alexandrium_andersonii.AAC.2
MRLSEIASSRLGHPSWHCRKLLCALVAALVQALEACDRPEGGGAHFGSPTNTSMLMPRTASNSFSLRYLIPTVSRHEGLAQAKVQLSSGS